VYAGPHPFGKGRASSRIFASEEPKIEPTSLRRWKGLEAGWLHVLGVNCGGEREVVVEEE